MNKNITERGPGGTVVNTYKEDAEEVFDANLNTEMAKRTDKLSDNSIELALRVKQAREFLAWSAHHMRGSWLDWMAESEKAVKETLQTRMSLERESKTVIAAGKDVVSFFNSPEYKEAHGRLSEMVGLLDRFSALKSNGTLDAFADFILKVSCK